MRFETAAAYAIGLLLPVLETARRGLNHWTIDVMTMLEDYAAGGLLLLAAVLSIRKLSKTTNTQATSEGFEVMAGLLSLGQRCRRP